MFIFHFIKVDKSTLIVIICFQHWSNPCCSKSATLIAIKLFVSSSTGPTHVVVNQPRSNLAKGPDPDMRKGPDKELLL